MLSHRARAVIEWRGTFLEMYKFECIESALKVLIFSVMGTGVLPEDGQLSRPAGGHRDR